MAAEYEIRAVDMGGIVSHVYEDAVLTEWIDELNGLGGCKFEIPEVCPIPFDGCGQEIQIWRNGALFDWLVSVRAKSDGRVVQVECKNLLWYLHRRVFGRANRTNHLNNPSFEADPVGAGVPTGWNRFGPGTTAIINSYFELGSKAVRLTCAAALADSYLGQGYVHTAGSIPDFGLLTVWFLLENLADTAIEQRGVYLDTLAGGVSQDPAWFPITNSTPTGVWTRVQSGATVPAGATQTYDCRLYCPQGSIIYDASSFVFMESIATPLAGEDQALLIEAILEYSQSVAQGKSWLNFGTDFPMTGINRIIDYQFVDHKNIWDALIDFTRYPDGVDLGMVFPDNQHRTVTSWAIVPGVSPGRGTLRADLAPLVLNVEIVSPDHTQDLEQTSTSVIIMSGQSGPAREEGGAIDTSMVPNGVILESVSQAPEYVAISSLDSLAQQKLKEVKMPFPLDVVKVRDTATKVLVGNLKVGDRILTQVQVDVSGFIQINEVRRITKMVLDPHTDTMDLTLVKTAF